MGIGTPMRVPPSQALGLRALRTTPGLLFSSARPGQWRMRQSVSCDAADNRSLRSLESLLGEEEEPATATSMAYVAPPVPRLDDKELKRLHKAGFYQLDDKVEPPKVPPTLSFIFYYWHVIVFLATEYLDAVEGLGAGDDYMSEMVNDHYAVLGGDWVRLISSPFVHASPWALLITLFALGVMGAELEGLLGYWMFGAFYAVISVSTGLLEAGADEFPITQGSLPVIAGMVGGLLVVNARNALFDSAVQKAKRKPSATAAAAIQGLAPPIQGSMDDDSQAVQGSGSKATGQPHDRGARGSHGAAGGKGKEEEEEEREVEVEFFEGLYKVNFTTSAPVQAFAAVATTAVGSFEALHDLSQSGGVSSTWAGVVVGLLSGVVLALGIAPAWTVDRVPWADGMAALQQKPPTLPWISKQEEQQQPTAAAASRVVATAEGVSAGAAAVAAGGLQGQGAAGRSSGPGAAGQGSSSSGGGGGGGQRMPDLLHVRDSVSEVQKVATLVVAAGACFAYFAYITSHL